MEKYMIGAKICGILGGVFLTTGGIIGEVLPPPETVDAFARTPAALALIALAGLCFYIAYKLMSRALDIVANEMSKTHMTLQSLSNELKERPCIRKPTNN